MSVDQQIREQIQQNDVTVMNSYLEVDIAQWFSDNKIPYAYEPFIIPSIESVGKTKWDEMIEAIHGATDFSKRNETYKIPNNGLTIDGENVDEIPYNQILNIWSEIFDRHKLGREQIDISVRGSLQRYGKRALLPDFLIYKNKENLKTEAKGVVANKNFNYRNFDAIIEVSGLWGVGLPDEATEEEWWKWYRVSAVAMKELAYKLLGLWDKVYWVIPFIPKIEGEKPPIPDPLKKDEHYIIFKTTQFTLNIPELKEKLGIFKDTINDAGKLSPNIELVRYERTRTIPKGETKETEPRDITAIEYKYDKINFDNIGNMADVFRVENDTIVYATDIGEIYVTNDTVQVRESMWRKMNMMILREHVVDSMQELSDNEIIEGFKEK